MLRAPGMCPAAGRTAGRRVPSYSPRRPDVEHQHLVEPRRQLLDRRSRVTASATRRSSRRTPRAGRDSRKCPRPAKTYGRPSSASAASSKASSVEHELVLGSRAGDEHAAERRDDARQVGPVADRLLARDQLVDRRPRRPRSPAARRPRSRSISSSRLSRRSGVSGAAFEADEDDRRDPLGRTPGDRERRVAAHRRADERELVAGELVEQLRRPAVDRVAAAVQPHGDAAERCDLPVPHPLVERPAVQPDRRHSERTISTSAANAGRVGEARQSLVEVRPAARGRACRARGSPTAHTRCRRTGCGRARARPAAPAGVRLAAAEGVVVVAEHGRRSGAPRAAPRPARARRRAAAAARGTGRRGTA